MNRVLKTIIVWERSLKHITSKYKELEDTLWQAALDAAGQMEIRPGGETSVRAWITVGIQRMERQGRLASEDLRWLISI
jgi:hypothetical protein